MTATALATSEPLSPEILVIDDEVEVGRFLDNFLTLEKGCRVTVVNSGTAARAVLGAQTFDLALVDLKLPDANGIDLLREIRAATPGCRVIIMTGHSTVRSAVEAVKLGAFDYVDKPFAELEDLEAILDRALADPRRGASGADETARLAAGSDIVLGPGSPMQPVLEVARKVAAKPITVLLHGATGTGKECVARFIHRHSRRAEQPFISVNCGAFAETLLASELFGHEKGAFTGAAVQRRGIFELADGGTLFLDEIGEASPAIQVKLLKVLESGEFMRVGGEQPIRVDVRVISATNVDLRQAVERGRFRKDLFYRLDVVSLSLPPLCERPGDIEALMGHFVGKALPAAGRETVRFSAAARAALLRYAWPGNVRELANVIAGAMALREGDVLDVDVLPSKVLGPGGGRPAAGVEVQPLLTEEGMDAAVRQLGEYFFPELMAGHGGLERLVETLKELESRVAAEVIRKALAHTGGDRAAAADLLRVNPRVLRYHLRERGR